MKTISRITATISLLALSHAASAAVTCTATQCTGPAKELITDMRVGAEWDGGTGSLTVYGYVLPSSATALGCTSSPKIVYLKQSTWPGSANQIHATVLQALALNRTIQLYVNQSTCHLTTLSVKNY